MQADFVFVVKPWLGISITVIGAFTVGGIFRTYRTMVRTMVTKDDLTIALLKFEKRFVTRDECAAQHSGKSNGSANRHHDRL